MMYYIILRTNIRLVSNNVKAIYYTLYPSSNRLTSNLSDSCTASNIIPKCNVNICTRGKDAMNVRGTNPLVSI